MIYLASDLELPIIAYDENNPSFYTSKLDNKICEQIKTLLTLPNTVTVGGAQGCACDFFGAPIAEVNDVEQFAIIRDHLNQLVKYILSIRKLGGKVHLFSCWNDPDGPKKPKDILKLNLETILTSDFEFEEDRLFDII